MRKITIALVTIIMLTGCSATTPATLMPTSTPTDIPAATHQATSTPRPSETLIPATSTSFPSTYTPYPTKAPSTPTPEVDYLDNMKAWVPDLAKYTDDISSILKLTGDDASQFNDPAFKRDILAAYQGLKDHVSKVREWKAPPRFEPLQVILVEFADRIDAEYDACTDAFKEYSTYKLNKCTAAINLRNDTTKKMTAEIKQLSQ